MLIDWVAALEPLTRGGWSWGEDGKIRMNNVAHAHVTPWLHAPPPIPNSREENVDCGYLTILHNYVFKEEAVHSFCMECYKVVVVLKSLEQVHKMAEWQHSTGWACKTGAERRPYTQRVWGAYFYCRGVEDGRERYKAVRAWVDENLGEDVEVFLKRACTEFEQHLGDSDKWEKIPYQDEIEEEALKVIDFQPIDNLQPEAIRHHVFNVWDAWDRDNQPPITYHEED